MEKTEANSSGSPEDAPDPALDFLSPNFCPEEALVCSPSRIHLPCPEVQPCDNLNIYSSVVRGLSRKPTSSGPAQLKEEREENLTVSVRKRSVRSVLLLMETPQLGPVSLVQRCFGEGVRVRVVVRHCAGVRGECVGTVLAFDKHLNLVLGDVFEEYTPFRTVTNGGLEPRAQRRQRRHRADGSGGEDVRNEREIKLHRHLDKLFIRGDNVVLISPVYHSSTP